MEDLPDLPDAPERIQQSTCPVSSSTRGITRMPGNHSPKGLIIIKIKDSSNQGQSSRGTTLSELSAPLATADFFKQAKLGRWLQEAKHSPPKLDRATGKSVVNGYGARTLGLNQSSSVSNCMSKGAGVTGNSFQSRERQVSHRDANVDSRGMGSGLPTIPGGKPQNCTKASTSNGLKEVLGAHDFSGWSPSEDKREAINIKGTAGLSSRTPCDVSPTVTRKESIVTDRGVGTPIPQSANQALSSSCSEGFNDEGKEIIHPGDKGTVASLRNRTTGISKGKRKHTSSSYHPGESSSSLNEYSGSCLGSGLSGYRDRTSSNPNIRAQSEADELLARELHEQLNPREETDAILAMSLQHEEDAGRTSRTIRRFQNNTRATRASRLSAAQPATRVRHETSISHFRNAAPITLGLRATVAGYPAARIQPNIDLNDYDALLALDENNHQHTGALESQINNLPESVYQPTSTEEERCPICLENPSVGDTIRTLPCRGLHNFHKACIDKWLRMKKHCPVCRERIE